MSYLLVCLGGFLLIRAFFLRRYRMRLRRVHASMFMTRDEFLRFGLGAIVLIVGILLQLT